MAEPLPWSFTALDDFKNCPRSYYAKRVIKSVVEPPSEQMLYGNRVHKDFERRQHPEKPVPLPEHLEVHEPFMTRLWDRPGKAELEMRVALNKRAEPCKFFGQDIWFRGVIDYLKIDGTSALVVDYKTGKPHDKFDQLHLFALNVFAMYPDVELVNSQFYWTKTGTITKKVVGRLEIPSLWARFIPDLKQYVQAFKTDTWQPRQSGLCHGWCPVKDCEYWRPKRN